MAFEPPARSAEPSPAELALMRRTLRFAVAVTADKMNRRLVGGHSVGNGHWFDIEETVSRGDTTPKVSPMKLDSLSELKNNLGALIDKKAAISKKEISFKEALEYFQEDNTPHCRSLLLTRMCKEKVACVECDGIMRLDIKPLLPNLESLVGKWKVTAEGRGFVVSLNFKEYERQSSLIHSHMEHIVFANSHMVRSVGDLNNLQQVGRERKDYVLHCELKQEQNLGDIADQMRARKRDGNPTKLICIAGPTSSGKTTFATKLCMHLRNIGFVAKSVTVDHYYLPLDRQPKYIEHGARSFVDYDHIESMDVDLVAKHLSAIVRGESIMTPVYDMKTGYRIGEGQPFEALPENGILVIEGIHALNPLYTSHVDAEKVFKIFISPLSALQVDDFNVVKTTDHRLLRRMCRDYLFRGHSASRTLSMWDNVRKGEGVWIFPHQNNVNFVMNSAADYEIPVLKTFLEPLLRGVRPDDASYEKAQELLQFLDLFVSFPPELTPSMSLLREFIGDGAFDCH